MAEKISPKPKLLRGWMVRLPSARASGPPLRLTRVSISAMVCRASSGLPCVTSQRGLSGSWWRRNSTPAPNMPPTAKPSRQPQSSGTTAPESSGIEAAAPTAAPSQ